MRWVTVLNVAAPASATTSCPTSGFQDLLNRGCSRISAQKGSIVVDADGRNVRLEPEQRRALPADAIVTGIQHLERSLEAGRWFRKARKVSRHVCFGTSECATLAPPIVPT